MKKTLLLIIFALYILLTFTFAAESEELYTDLDVNGIFSEEYEGFASSVKDSMADRLPDSFGSSAEADAAELSTWSFVISAFGESFASAIRVLLPWTVKLIGVITASSLINSFAECISQKSASLLTSVSTLCVSAVFILMQGETVLLVKDHLESISSLASCMLPVFLTLYAAGGNTAGAAVGGGALSVFTFITEKVIARVALPFFGSLFCLVSFSAVGVVRLDGLIRLVKRTYTNALTFTMSLFCAILSCQSLIASGRDSVSLRAVRFVTSSGLPVVGSSVGESLKSFAAGIGMIRKSVGVIGVVCLLMLTLPTVILLILNGIALNLVASIAELLGCTREKQLLESISGIYGCLTATVAVSSLMFGFMLILLAISAVALKG